MMIADWLNQFFAVVGAPVAVGALIDQVMKAEHKDKVSAYVFGERNTYFLDLERNVILGLMKIFLRDNNSLIIWRIVIIGWALSISGILALTNFIEGSPTPSELFEFILPLMIPALIFSLPIDIWSLWVTKQLFVLRHPKALVSLIYIVIDLTVSTLILIWFLYLNWDGSVTSIINRWLITTFSFSDLGGLNIGSVISFAIFSAAASASMISVVQLVATFSGLLARFFVVVTKISAIVSQHSRFRKLPFTFLGVMSGVVLALVS